VSLCAPLLGAIAHSVNWRAAPRCGRRFFCQQVHRGIREVVQPAGMVEVEVREHDVAHVVRTKAECLDLTHCRHLRPQLGLDERKEELRQSTPRVGDVA